MLIPTPLRWQVLVCLSKSAAFVIRRLFPIGIFSGSMSQFTVLVCGYPNQPNIKWAWYCGCASH